ncbi:MAG TPA: NADP oxidoreductase, partial [Bacteroidetes bacterium]|nr:NADP oxidoreductase [Bacteroidota bacterium]
MSNYLNDILSKYKDKSRLMDIFNDIQAQNNHISDEDVENIATYFNISSVDVVQTLSFYHFFRRNNSAKYNIYLNKGIVSELYNHNKIAKAFEKATKTKFNSISEDGMFGLYDTSDIGMCDQEPAAIINGIVFPKITTFRVREIIKEFRNGKSAKDLINSFGDGHNQDELIQSMVTNNLNRRGRVIFAGYESGSGLKKALKMKPEEVIELVKNSNIRGRGGAGFPIGLKWKYCRESKGEKKYIVCNADEGEPGTFKDRVLLTELPMDIFEGMCIAAYAVGASEGIIYLRKEYEYLFPYLHHNLNLAKEQNILGTSIMGKKGFDFNIRIQLGAGAYVCGEESALLESCEGKRGEPRNRPPFPIEKGYLDMPTVINNVESLNAIPKIIFKGYEWYRGIGTKESTGTKLISISGDVLYPGV